MLRVLSGIEEEECLPGTGDPLPTSDLGRIVYTYRRWRGEPAPDWWENAPKSGTGFQPVGFPDQRLEAAATSPGMPPEAFAALPTRFVDSELGPVPEGWEVKAIGDVVCVRGGGTPSTKNEDFWNGGTHCWATPKDLSSLQHPVLLSTDRRITDAGVRKISSGLLPIDTVLMSSRAPVGYLALAKVPIAVNQGFIAITCTGPLKPHYVLQWLRANMEEIKGRASGTTFAEISKSAFRPIPAIVPPSTLVNAFEEYARPIVDLITHAMMESSKLAALRDYLLPRLLSGRVRVKSIDQLEPIGKGHE